MWPEFSVGEIKEDLCAVIFCVQFMLVNDVNCRPTQARGRDQGERRDHIEQLYSSVILSVGSPLSSPHQDHLISHSSSSYRVLSKEKSVENGTTWFALINTYTENLVKKLLHLFEWWKKIPVSRLVPLFPYLEEILDSVGCFLLINKYQTKGI